jgi:hypothetical protein
VTTAMLDPSMSAGIAQSSSGAGWPLSDRYMYVAVTAAWCRLFSRDDRRKHPLGPYVLGRGFGRSVASAPIEGVLVAYVCARIAYRHTLQQDRGELLSIELSPREALDPAAAWWRELERSGGLGVHYVELGGGTLEFLSVAHRDDPPYIGGSRLWVG